MDSINWERMPFIDFDSIESGRTEDLKVFLPPRKELLPPNQCLDRVAVVMADSNQYHRYLTHRFSTKLDNFFHRDPKDFRVSKVHKSIGDCLVIFSDTQLQNQAVRICAFSLGPRVEVQLIKWRKEVGMVYDLTTHLARIKLHGIPLQNWNEQDLNTLVSDFGSLVRVAPFFTNDNFEQLRILVDCHHPINIPRNLSSTTTPYAITVQVVLEGWLHALEAMIPRYLGDAFGGDNAPTKDNNQQGDRQPRDEQLSVVQQSHRPTDKGMSLQQRIADTTMDAQGDNNGDCGA